MTLTEYITKHKKTHLIFDFDATLVMMNIPWSKWTEGLQKKITQLDVDLWRQYEQDHNPSGIQNLLVQKHGDVGRELIMRHSPPFELRYSDKFDRNDPLLKEVEAFRDNYHMFIWSSNSRELVTTVLQDIGMSDWFDKVITRSELRFIKPDPEGFELIRDPKVPKEKYLMIGDSSHDRAAAQAAGIDFYKTDFWNKNRYFF